MKELEKVPESSIIIWVSFCESVKYEPSKEFLDELIAVIDEKAQAKEAKKEQKNINDLKKAIFIV